MKGRIEWYDYGARFYEPAIGRWQTIDPMAEEFNSWTPYHYVHNNPMFYTDPTGMSASTHTDEDGVVIEVKNDGDLGVYKHEGKGAEAKKDVDKKYSTENPSAGGEKMGETWTALGFADFSAYEKDGTVKPAMGAKIDFDSNWATERVNEILNSNPSVGGYAMKARGGHDWDIKTKTKSGNPYFGSKLFGKYASARDAGNFAAGAVAQMSNMPNAVLDYGFGTYNKSGNNIGVSFLMIGADAVMFPINPSLAAKSIYNKIVNGEDKLSKMGIEAGKTYIKKR